jgi:protein phosphatase
VGVDVIQSSDHVSHRWIDASEVLISVADGVAVSPAAARASRLALKYLHEPLGSSQERLADGLIAGRHVRAAQARLCSTLAGNPRTHGASTTIVSAHLRVNRVAVLNVGDSRAYLRTADGCVTQLSHDHSQHESLMGDPGFKEGVEYASIYDALSDSLVADPEEAEFACFRTTLAIRGGDMIILCSDGVWDVLGAPRLCELIARASTPDSLVKRIRSEVRAAGAPENYSVIAARLAVGNEEGAQG